MICSGGGFLFFPPTIIFAFHFSLCHHHHHDGFHSGSQLCSPFIEAETDIQSHTQTLDYPLICLVWDLSEL